MDIQAGQKVKYLDEIEWVYGTVERVGCKRPDLPQVAIVQWDDGKNTSIYADRLTLVQPS